LRYIPFGSHHPIHLLYVRILLLEELSRQLDAKTKGGIIVFS
jgi:hypothetical protein